MQIRQYGNGHKNNNILIVPRQASYLLFENIAFQI